MKKNIISFMGSDTFGIMDNNRNRKTISFILKTLTKLVKPFVSMIYIHYLIKKALIHTSENRTQAAKILGVSIRTLRNKIRQ